MNLKRVPVYFDIDGKKTEIGTALVDNDMGCATISLDGPQADLLRQSLIPEVSISIDPPLAGIDCPDHKPRQHRDGKPPWCRECGLTANFEMPIGILDRAAQKISDESQHDFTD